jgi:uncharacterized membrane protein
VKMARLLRHLFATKWQTRRCFGAQTLQQIEAAVREVEARQSGEVRFVIETALGVADLWADVAPRERALHAFSLLRVWDTANNNGVLIYVLLADRDVEIVADRGVAARVRQEEWERVCREIEAHFREGRFAQGSVAGVQGVGRLLAQHFPDDRGDADELPNQPVLL